MKQRLAIASALLGDPNILVFDEPTNGLDPAGIAEIRALIIALNEQGKTIIMASHILDEVEKVCTHVAIIQKGILKTTGTVAELMVNNAGDNAQQDLTMTLNSKDNEALKKILSQMKGFRSISILENEVRLNCDTSISGEQVNQYCFDHGIVLQSLSVKRKSLETRFLEITGRTSDK
jgi:ABC-2 type transport system ATP-binding protein